MTTLTEFLLARIAEDEAVARAASGGTVEGEIGNWRPVASGDEWAVGKPDEESLELLVALRSGLPRPPQVMSGYWGVVADWEVRDERNRIGDFLPLATHMARWDPARVLAECEAKRRIVHEFELADPYELDNGLPALGVVLQALAQPYANHPDFDRSWLA